MNWVRDIYGFIPIRPQGSHKISPSRDTSTYTFILYSMMFINVIISYIFKDHFRVSSSGSCLRCSKCPYKLDLVVPECSDKLGHHNSHICWPQEITKAKPDISTTGMFSI
jgi:hypothetical protein